MAGLPACFRIFTAFPKSGGYSHIPHSFSGYLRKNTTMKLTATGIASVFHRIPILKFRFR